MSMLIAELDSQLVSRENLAYEILQFKQIIKCLSLFQCMLCFCKCCFYCLEKFMKFLNRNAYIMTAVYGKNFCWSAKEAFKLLFRNLARVVVLDKVTDFLLLLGKLVIVGGVGVASFYVFSGRLQVRFLFNVIFFDREPI